MSLLPHHTSDPSCALCNDKLTLAHPDLAKWFNDLKSRHPNAHVSWSFRDQQSQEQAFQAGTTKLHFPDSAHNKQPAMALDIFQINDAGQAIWDPIFLCKVNQETLSLGYNLKWGGSWPSLGDRDHWELDQPVSPQVVTGTN